MNVDLAGPSESNQGSLPSELPSGDFSARAALYLLAAIVAACGMGPSSQEPREQGGVIVYRQIPFDEGASGFRSVRGATIELTMDAVSGRALSCQPRRPGAGVELPVDIHGSQGLKIAFLAKGREWPRAFLNVYDRRTRDNTTSYAPRFLDANSWTPVLYSLDGFRYNSRRDGTVDEDTSYSSVRFFTPDVSPESQLLLDNVVIYRGRDKEPPRQVEGLTATSTAQGMQLAWQPAVDNTGVMAYVVSRRRAEDDHFTKVAETSEPQWLDKTARPGPLHYRVLAVDFERNLGPWTESVTARSEAPLAVYPSINDDGKRTDWGPAVRMVHRRGAGRVRKGHVCFFGDSLTYAKVYPQMGQAALGVFSVASHGFPRVRTDFGRDKVEEILDLENPEFLLVLLGTNNLNTGRIPTVKELDLWMADFEAIATSAHERGTIVIFGTVPPRGFDDPESMPEATFNRALHGLADRLGVPVAPIFEDLQAYGDRGKLLAKDGVHWRPEGMMVAGKAWGNAVREVEWLLRDR